MEFYNLFNKTQFRADQDNFQLANTAVACLPGTVDVRCAGHADNTVAYDQGSMGQGNFGQITKTRGPREIQYALKITF